MRLDRKMVYLNAGFLAVLGIGFALKAAPLPAYAGGKPWETLATERLLGMMIGGVGLALWFLRRLTQPRDFKRLTLGWLLINVYLFQLFCVLAERRLNPLDADSARFDLRIVGLGAVHIVLFFGCCATVVWKRGTEFRRVFQALLLTEASLATLAGYGLVLAVQTPTLLWSPGLVLRLLGAELAGLALTLIILGNPANVDDRRRLLLGLGAGNGLSAVMALIQLNVWGSDSRPGWALVLIQVALAVGSVWAGLQPERGRPRPTPTSVVSRMTLSCLLAGAVAGGVALAAPALALDRWAVFGLSLVLALGVAALFVGDIQRDLKAAGLDAVPVPGLEEEAARQTWLRQVSEAAAQEERNRLARDLHDSIKQQIFGIHVSAAAAQARWESDPEGARKALADVRRSAHEAMVEMQAMLHQLRPQALAGTGLVEALREQCEALGYRSGAEVSLELGNPVPDERLPPGAQETLFRIAQEALANVARHARAHKVRVGLGREGEAVRLQVEDDGQGFDPGTATAGMGLRNLRERSESLQGALEITSTPGAGTRITVFVPLAPALVREPNLRKEPWSTAGSMLLWLAIILFQWTDRHHYRDSFEPKLHWIFNVLLFSLVVAGFTGYLHYRLRRAPGPRAPETGKLRFDFYSGNAALLFGAYWILQPGLQLPGTWATAGRAILTVCLLLASWEIVQVFRWSRRRPWSGGWEWPQGLAAFRNAFYGLLTLVAVGFALPLLRALDAQTILLLVSWAALTVFLLLRQPRAEGASS